MLNNKKSKIKRDLLICSVLIAVSGIISLIALLLSLNTTGTIKAMPMITMWVITAFLLVVYYFYLDQDLPGNNTTPLVTFSTIFICYVLCAVVMSQLNMAAMPYMLCALLMVTLVNKKQAILGNVMLAFILLLAYIVRVQYYLYEFSFENVIILLIKMCGGLLIVYLINEQHNRIKIIGIGFGVSMIVSVFCILTGLVVTTNVTELLMSGGWSLLGSVSALILYFILSPVFEWVFKLNTNLQIMEYLSFDKDLLKQLAEKAPGTFNHSIAVGNLAERCAYAIGENVNLAKAAAYYHDIGKLQNPEYFTENQTDGYNPHDDLAFETSVSLITRHTEAGYNMLKEKGFPTELAQICREHHGTSKLLFFYIRAQNITEGEVDSGNYCYPGPKPSTKISAIIMICDTVEAATRSIGKKDPQELSDFIKKLVKDKLDDGQFDDCNITMKELHTIIDTLTVAIIGSNHTRIQYPEKKKK